VDDPWLPLVLTLDGGGIRGYTSLIILQRLMEEVAVWETRLEAQEKPSGHARQVFKAEELQPCLYFDFMYGTSTGGLIATMLGRLRMTVPSCLEVYRKVGNELFGKKRNTLPLGTKYYNEPLEEAVKRIVKEHCPIHKDDEECGGMDWNPWSLDDDGTDLDPDNPFYADSPDRICQS
jgi:patatin-like phospholipase/acyl hydrolase